jgi:hypothetical protein
MPTLDWLTRREDEQMASKALLPGVRRRSGVADAGKHVAVLGRGVWSIHPHAGSARTLREALEIALVGGEAPLGEQG